MDGRGTAGSGRILIRPAEDGDREAIWAILEPVIRGGDTYALERDMTQADALAYWMNPAHSCFVSIDEIEANGTYYLRPNQPGGGAHVANCGFMVSPAARGRGIARLLCEHALAEARRQGYLAMQFNFVVSSNQAAVRLWEAMGFSTVGRLPLAFRHPRDGLVDALVMFRSL